MSVNEDKYELGKAGQNKLHLDECYLSTPRPICRSSVAMKVAEHQGPI